MKVPHPRFRRFCVRSPFSPLALFAFRRCPNGKLKGFHKFLIKGVDEDKSKWDVWTQDFLVDGVLENFPELTLSL